MPRPLEPQESIVLEPVEQEKPAAGEASAQEAKDFAADMVGFFTEVADVLGIPRSVAAIYGTVFASPLPLCFSDVEQRLDLSRGSVSQGLRFLHRIGALKASGEGNGRREYYVPDLELRRFFLRMLSEKVEPQVKSSGKKLKALLRDIPFADAEDADTMRNRILQLQNWHRKTRNLIPVAKAFLNLTLPRTTSTST